MMTVAVALDSASGARQRVCVWMCGCAGWRCVGERKWWAWASMGVCGCGWYPSGILISDVLFLMACSDRLCLIRGRLGLVSPIFVADLQLDR